MSPYLIIAEAIASAVAPGARIEASTTEASFAVGPQAIVRVLAGAPAEVRLEAGSLTLSLQSVGVGHSGPVTKLISLLVDALDLE